MTQDAGEEQTWKWDVFVSHNRHQKPWVRTAVAQWRELGLKVFFDEDSIIPGEPIVSGIERGLAGSRHVVLVITPSAVSSKWVAMEIAQTVFTDPDAGERRIIPVILELTDFKAIRLSIRSLSMVSLVESESRELNYRRLLESLGLSKSFQVATPAWPNERLVEDGALPHAAADTISISSVQKHSLAVPSASHGHKIPTDTERNSGPRGKWRFGPLIIAAALLLITAASPIWRYQWSQKAVPPVKSASRDSQSTSRNGPFKAEMASFGDLKDLKAFQDCKAKGGTDAECTKVGDNGIGKWGAFTAQINAPMVAMNKRDAVARWGNLDGAAHHRVRVIVRGKSVICAVEDLVVVEGRMDLNPAAAKLLGLVPPFLISGEWEWMENKDIDDPPSQ